MYRRQMIMGLLMLLTVVTSSCARGTVFYVAVDGNDRNPGTLNRPFASLEKAKAAVGAVVKQGLKQDVLVCIRGGTYRLEKPLAFGSGDGGTDKHSVTYAAYNDENVVLSGGRLVKGWQSGADDMWTTRIADVKVGKWSFRQLYADGKRLARGRYPEKGYLKLKSKSKDSKVLTISQGLPAADLGGRDAEVIVVQNWSISREIIAKSSASTVTTCTPMGWVGHSHCYPKPGMSVFLENDLSFVTQSGQWYLDRKTGTLHYKSTAGGDPNQCQFVAPVLTQLVVVKGTREAPVRNLHFRGLQFMHTAWHMPDIGYGGIQACYHSTDMKAPTFAVPVAVELIHCVGGGLEKCRLLHLGGSGVGLGAGCRENKVVGCEFADIGGTGVNVGHMLVKLPLWADWKNPADVPTGNEITNCYIHHCGEELWGGHGIFDAMTKDTKIRRNEVAWIPYGGIATGYVWNTERTSQENCLIENNHIYEVMLRLNDSGCVYTLGFQPGSVIRGNLMHGVRIGGYAGGQVCNNGIFFDEGSKGFLIEGNVIFDVDQRKGARNTPVRFNRSKQEWLTWIDNTLVTDKAMPEAGKKLLGKVGIEPAYRKFLKGGK